MPALASGPPVVVAVLAVAVWLAAVARTTPWSSRLPRATAADEAAWPALSGDRARGHRLVARGWWLSQVGVAAVLLALMSAPGARLLLRLAPEPGGARTGLVSAAVLAVVALAAVPGSALSRPAGPLLGRLAATWRAWARSWALRVAALTAAGVALVVFSTDELRDDPSGGWVAADVTLAVGAAVGGSLTSMGVRRRLRDLRPPDARLDGIVRELLQRTGIAVPLQVHTATVRGLEPGGMTWGVRAARIVVEPRWAVAPDAELAGLVAHELAHVARGDIARRTIRVAAAVCVLITLTIAAISSPTLRGWAHAGPDVRVTTVPLAVAITLVALRLLAAVELLSRRREEARADLLASGWTPGGAAPFLAHYAAVEHARARCSRRQLLTAAAHPDLVDRVAGLPVVAAEGQSASR